MRECDQSLTLLGVDEPLPNRDLNLRLDFLRSSAGFVKKMPVVGQRMTAAPLRNVRWD